MGPKNTVHHQNLHQNAQKAERLKAMLDNHSKWLMLKSRVFNLFGISGHPPPFTLKTGSSIIETRGRKTRN